MIHYLSHIQDTWKRILQDEALVDYVDEASVEAVQLRAPKISQLDRDFIQLCMESGKLFPGIKDNAIRASVLKNLLSIHLIPSLYTFLKDMEYLKPCAKIMKRLIPKPPKQKQMMTLRRRYQEHFLYGGNITVQTSEFTFSYLKGSWHEAFDLHFQQLFIYCERHCPDMDQCSPRMDKGAKKPIIKEPNAHVWFKLAQLAANLGFKSPQIDQLLREMKDELIVPARLHGLRPKSMYRIDHTKCQTLVQRVCNSLDEIYIPLEPTSGPSLTVPGDGEPLNRRCGIPHEKSLEQDVKHLFLDRLQASDESFSNAGDGISSFFIKRAVFHAFFGHASLDRLGREDPAQHHPRGPGMTQVSSYSGAVQPASSTIDNVAQPPAPITTSGPVHGDSPQIDQEMVSH
jgi:hypothetical protein